MGTLKCRGFVHVPFYLFLLILFTCNRSSTSQEICKNAFCGMGTCEETSTEIQGFRCNCKSGWLKIDVPLISSPCIIPNCTYGSGCKIPLFPPPPPPKQLHDLPPPVCLFCGNGSCELKGLLDFECHCYEGSANLLNNPHLPCFPTCAIHANCSGGLDLGFGDPPPSPSPPPQQSGSPAGPSGGSGEMPNSSRELLKLTTMVLATIFLNWI